MASAPIITFRQVSSPWALQSGIPYVQTAPDGTVIPVTAGENSNSVLFRIYNNFGLAAGIATAANVTITVYDGAGSGSHTCVALPVSTSWVHMQEYGYGENSTTNPDQLTAYLGTDTAIGGSAPCGVNTYAPEVGSDGSSNAQIRAYSSGNGMGYIEFSSYISVPNSGVQNASYTFAISCQYEWTP